MEVTIPPHTVPHGSTVGIKIQPGFASSDVFVMPEGVQPASPSYLMTDESSTNLNGEVTVTMEHHVKVTTKEEASDLLFLRADMSPKVSGSNHIYEYQKVLDGRAEFIPGKNKGTLTTRHKQISKKFLKVGFRDKFKKDRSGMCDLQLSICFCNCIIGISH